MMTTVQRTEGTGRIPRPPEGPEQIEPGDLCWDDNGICKYVITSRHHIKPMHWTVRLLARIFPWWTWGRFMEVEGYREDRLEVRLDDDK
jgi:hypothetical protein